MNSTVLCQSCGNSVEVPEDHTRRKIRCPNCGVMCELPSPNARQVQPAKRPPRASAPPPHAEETPPKPDAKPRRTEAPGPQPRRLDKDRPDDRAAEPFRPAPPGLPPLEEPGTLQKGLLTCRHCGESFRRSQIKRQGSQCPNCGEPWEPPPRRAPSAVMPPRKTTPPPEPDMVTSQEDDGKPYAMADRSARKCPSCARLLEAEAVLCVRCGFNLETGAAARKTYQAVSRCWESGLPLYRRWLIFFAWQAIVLPLLLLGAWQQGSLYLFVVPWLILSGLLAFLVGTFDRLELTRTTRGRVTLTKTLYVAFVRCRPVQIPLADYEGVATGMADDRGFTDWVILFILLGCGILPGILFWYYVLCADTYFVALSKGHGSPEDMLYRGWDKSHMEDIAHTVRDVGAFPY